jgi:DNA-binding Lrp family transcriptional regulator
VPALDQHIGADHHPAVRGAEHRRVVPRTQQGVPARRRPRGHPADQPELSGIGDSDGTPSSVTLLREINTLGYVLPSLPVPTSKGLAVVQAYILIQTEVGKAAQVAREISGIKGVTVAEDVTGPYDVIVRAEARNVDELGKLVVAKVQAVDGITRTLTCPVVHL